ncbi:unnamed protein product [Blepharisma stoltei]|uniref:Uncharacterized protein n=1 Tax=Blepharisma stoltei TaxID=1481888 RepID=A0AAU9JBW0_9CILI|nr:unnamed protein product [Blepharisma stoltei]
MNHKNRINYTFSTRSNTSRRTISATRTHDLSKSSRLEIKKRPSIYSSLQVQYLLEELETLWVKYDIPNQHQMVFKSLIAVSPTYSAIIIAKEISMLEENQSPILNILRTIQERELTLSKIQLLAKKFRKKKCKDLEMIGLELANLIEKMRDKTIEVIERVQIWKKLYECHDIEFVWKGINYYEKLKSDLDFLVATPLANIFPFTHRDPFLLNVIRSYHWLSKKCNMRLGLTNLQKKQVKISLKFLDIEDFSDTLNQEFNTLRSAIEIPDVAFDRLFTPKNKNIVKRNLKEAVKAVCEDFINGIVDKDCLDICNENLQEKSRIINDICAEIIFDSMIESISEQASIAVSKRILRVNQDLIVVNELSDSIVDKLTDFECKNLCYEFLNEFLLDELCYDLIPYSELKPIVSLCIKEMDKEDAILSSEVCTQLIEDFLSSEWIETLVEAEKLSNHIEGVMDSLPIKLQKQVWKEERSKIYEQVIEKIYFDILNIFVGGFWLERLATASLLEVQGMRELPMDNIFVLHDPKDYRSSLLRRPWARRKSVYDK